MHRKVLNLFALSMISTVAWAAGGSSFDIVMEHYEPIRLALLQDSMNEVSQHGRSIAAELRVLESDCGPDRAGVSGETLAIVEQKLPEMIAAADAIASASSLEAARDGLYALSKPMVRWREGVNESDRPSVAYCPMHKRSWLQAGDEIGNPYGGMPGCGSIVSK